ncbi:MAG: tRNA (adenosine(37)-N6)-threonylcarbamoyltransferase complex ATPase subunit type 1 TsaE [Candidatus Marinimicrobia bacterium]|nr:tRNA (adenosine(37)-N6)-threonylcarbamoyltransferase complex ATPase subunit type 1 TsaE [Candidatus Neomarinimicrobiota bacterium]|tara:strand:+ start:1814 stop:2269 length:456 start_codon:yes stop_codon:yes gene_type:complete
MLKYNLSQINVISKKVLLNLSKTDCIFLFGELGSGKTTFARSLINQLQEKNKVNKTEVPSPTFNLLYEYEIKSLKVMHYDLYRLKTNKEIGQLGIFEDSSNLISIIEWPEKIKKKVQNRLELTFCYEKDEKSRKIKFQGFGKWKNFKPNAI